MAGEGKAKFFSFVSSTSALDTDYFVNLSDELLAQGKMVFPKLTIYKDRLKG